MMVGAWPRSGRGAGVLHSLVVPALVFALIAAVSMTVIHRMAVEDQLQILEHDLAEKTGVIDARLERFGSLVAGAAAHYSRTPHDPATITDEELQGYLQSLGPPEDYEDLPRGISYIVRVTPDELIDYTARRRLTHPQFTVEEGPYRVYQAIVWAQSIDTGHLGIRLDTDPERASAMQEAIAHDETRMTAPIVLRRTSTTGLNVYSPVVAAQGTGASSPDTGSANAAPLGWVGAALDVDQIVTTPHSDRTSLTITDQNLTVYGEELNPDTHLMRSTTLQVMGRSWHITTSTEIPLFESSALVASLSLALLAALGVAWTLRTRSRLVSDVDTVRRDRDRYVGFLDTLLANVDVGIVACDEAGTIVLANEASRRMHGGTNPSGGTDRWIMPEHRLDADGRPRVLEELPLYRALQGDDVHDEEFQLHDGEAHRTLLINAQPLRGGDDAIMGAVLALHDITDRKSAEAEMTWLALHDHLTGLANRRQMSTTLAAALADHAAGGPEVTLLFMDLDRFKVVNDTVGHHRGDQMLVDVAEQLTACSHDGDLAARMGGDEFVLVCPHARSADEARELAEAISSAVAPSLVVEGNRRTQPGLSVGIVRPAPGSSVEDVLRHADLAMYEAKRDSTSTIRIHEPATPASVEFATEASLRQAIASAGLEVVFQPIVSAADGATGAVEALVRWHHGGLVLTPGSFLPLAEQAGLMADVDLLVLEEACRAAALPTTPGRVHVNVHPTTLTDPRILAEVEDALARHHLRPERLCLEVTESALTAGPDVRRVLETLAGMGVHLALDDFGSGQTSLTALRGFPGDIVKIDGEIVGCMCCDVEDRAVITATVQLAASLGLTTVAEGVETAPQLEALTAMGCDLLQGFLLGRPATLPQPDPADPAPQLSA